MLQTLTGLSQDYFELTIKPTKFSNVYHQVLLIRR